jgi:hypothetical protein
VNKSTWTSLGDCYMYVTVRMKALFQCVSPSAHANFLSRCAHHRKDSLKGLLDEVVARREDERSHAFAQELVQKYSYYFT